MDEYADILSEIRAEKGIQEVSSVQEPFAKTPVETETSWYNNMIDQSKKAGKLIAEPEIKLPEEKSQISPLLSPVLAVPEIAGQLTWGMASWVPSKLTGLGQIGLQKMSNAIFKSESENPQRTPEERAQFKTGVYSPEKIRELADQAEAWWHIMPEPATKEAKVVLEKVGKGLDWLLSPFKIADEYYTKKGYPSLGYALRFIGEGLYFKGLHGVKTTATSKLKVLRKKLIKKAPINEVADRLEGVLDEIKISKEPAAPEGDALKRVTKSQKIKAHKIQREQDLSKAEYMEIAERLTGETSIKDMNKASAGEFIKELKKGKKALRPELESVKDKLRPKLKEVKLPEDIPYRDMPRGRVQPEESIPPAKVPETIRLMGLDKEGRGLSYISELSKDAQFDALGGMSAKKGKIIVYRAGQNEIRQGDFVTFSKKSADMYLEGAGKDAKIYTKELALKELYSPNPNEALWLPKKVIEIPKLEPVKEIKKAEKVREIDTAESLAKEFDLRYMGESEGLEYYSMKVPEGETTLATKGVNREALVKRVEEIKEQFKIEKVKEEITEPIVEKPEEVKDAEEVRREVKVPSEKERIVEEEAERLRVRDAERDRMEAERREAKEEIKPAEEPISETAVRAIADDIRTLEDMGFYAEVSEMIGKGMKVGTIMKELKQKPYYKEDMVDFGYTEKDIRSAIRAAKTETGDIKAVRDIQKKIVKEEKAVERVEAEPEPEPEISLERVDPITGRPPGMERTLERLEKLPDEAVERYLLSQQPLTGETGKVLKTKFAAERRAKDLGKVGELVENPKGEGWLIKESREERVRRDKAEAEQWETILKEEEGELRPEEDRVDVDVDTFADIVKGERGAITLDRDIISKIIKFPLIDNKLIKATIGWYNSGGSPYHISELVRSYDKNIRLTATQRKNIAERLKRNYNELQEYIDAPRQNGEPALKTTRNRRRRIQDRMLISDYLYKEFIEPIRDSQIKRLRESYVKDPKHPNYNDPLGANRTAFDDIIKVHSKSIPSEGFSLGKLTAMIKNMTRILKEKGREREYKKDVVDLSIIRGLKGERGAITFRPDSIKKLKKLIKKGYYTRNRIIKELRKRGASDEDILKVFPDVSIHILNEGKESKWWKRDQDSLELLPRRTRANKMKAPAITRGEAHMIATMKDLPPSLKFEGSFLGLRCFTTAGTKTHRLTAEHFSLENAIRTFEKLPPEIKETFYRTVKEGESLSHDHLQDVLKRSKKIRNSISYLHHKRIGIHAIAQQPNGIAVLAQQGITKIPKLKSKELKAYDDLRIIYDELFPLLNRARKAAGEKPFSKMENYFTWIQDLHWLEKNHGIGLFSDIRTIESKMAEIKRVPSFRYAKERAGPDRPRKLNLNPFAVMDVYAKTATHYIEMAPRLAKLNELLNERFKMAQNAPNAYNFIKHWLNYQAGKIPAWDIANPIVRRSMQILNSNIVYSLLAFNVRSTLIQPAALASSYAMLGEYYTAAGIVQMMSPSKWKMAGKKSNVLSTRSPDVALYEAMEASGKIPGLIQKKIGQVGLMPLTALDSVAARITWLGAYEKGLKRLKMSEKNAINYADDIVTKTQASAARSDIAPIQRTQLGKTVTCLQTFVINHWGFLTKDVMGIKNANVSNPQTVKRVIRFVLATTAVNAFFEDGLHLNSPNPTPIRAYRQTFEDTEDHGKAFSAAVKEIAEYVPIWGGRLRYGSEIGGPALTETLKLIEKGDVSALTKLIGIPGSNQFFKMVKAYERGGTDLDILLGRYPELSRDWKKGVPSPAMKGPESLID